MFEYKWPKKWLPHPGTIIGTLIYFLVVPRFTWSWPLVLFILVPYYWGLRERPTFWDQTREALWLMLGWGSVAYTWMPDAAGELWHGPKFIIWISYFILCPLTNVHLLFHTWSRYLFSKAFSGWQLVILSAASYATYEYFLIFLDIKIGYYFYTRPEFLSLASLGGGALISFFIAGFAEVIGWKKKTALGLSFCFLSFLVFIINQNYLTSKTVKVALFQTNRTAEETRQLTVKKEKRNYSSIDRHLDLLEKSLDSIKDVPLTIFPEAFVTMFYFFKDAPEGQLRRDRFEKFIPHSPYQFVFGAPRMYSNGFLNSLVVASKDDKINYETRLKRRPMPFGESLPMQTMFPWLEDFFFKTHIKIWTEEVPMIFSVQDVKWGGGICNEIFHSDLSYTQRNLGADFGVSIGNEVWVKGPAYRFLMAATTIRAVENRTSIVKVANAGISTVIDPLGREIYMSKPLEEGVAIVDVPISSQEKPFFSLHPKFFISLFSAFLGSGLIVAFFRLRRKRYA